VGQFWTPILAKGGSLLHADSQQGKVKSRAELAKKEGVSRARITQILNLLNLAPEIQSYLLTFADRKTLQILTERRLRTIAKITNQKQQMKKFRKLIFENIEI
jgi:hypothetical protein